MNKNYFSARNAIIGILTLAIGVVAFFGIAKTWAMQTTSVSGNIVSFILSPNGKVEGAILDSGDQVKFGEQTGELVAAQIKVGDKLTANGFAGSNSTHGREFKAQTVQIGEQTITVVGGKPHHEKGEKGKNPRHEKGDKGDKGEKRGPKDGVNQEVSTDKPATEAKETAKVTSNVRFVLVGKNGESRGLILADGTQIPLPKEVKDATLNFTESTNVSVEGEISKGQFGNFIRLTILTIDSQIFSFNR